MSRVRFLLIGLLCLAACYTSPLGRRRLMVQSTAGMAQMGEAAFAQIREATPTSQDRSHQGYVSCVANALIAKLPSQGPAQDWEIAVFDEDSANAFALPGGYMGVHSGMFEVALNQHQLAAVIAHEISHVTAEHPNERMSTQIAVQLGMTALQQMGDPASAGAKQLMGALGVGANVGILLPFGRAQEREADLLGLDLMAAAGFDPRQSVDLWRNMAASGGQKPPEFLSTHPSSQTRMTDLQARMSHAMAIYEDARSRGVKPNC